MDLELDLTPAEIAGIFMAKGWQIDGTEGPFPTPEEIGSEIHGLVAVMNDEPEMSYAPLCRLVVFRDYDFPGSVEICLSIGRAMPALGDDADNSDSGVCFG